jgi:hypothetical protein
LPGKGRRFGPALSLWDQGGRFGFRSFLFSADLNDHSSAAGAVEFAEEYTLPGTEVERIVLNEDLPAATDEGAFAMGIRVALKMAVSWSMRRYQFLEGQEYIVGDGAVGVFVYGDGGSSVRTIDYQVAVGDAGLTDD